jgi:hypothetical protein
MFRFLTIELDDKFEEYKKKNRVEKNVLDLDRIRSSTGRIEYGIGGELEMINDKGDKYFG